MFEPCFYIKYLSWIMNWIAKVIKKILSITYSQLILRFSSLPFRKHNALHKIYNNLQKPKSRISVMIVCWTIFSFIQVVFNYLRLACTFKLHWVVKALIAAFVFEASKRLIAPIGVHSTILQSSTITKGPYVYVNYIVLSLWQSLHWG